MLFIRCRVLRRGFRRQAGRLKGEVRDDDEEDLDAKVIRLLLVDGM
jgi:hypothetical protein